MAKRKTAKQKKDEADGKTIRQSAYIKFMKSVKEAKAKALEGLTAHPDMATADIVQATEVSPDDLVSSDSQLDNQETYTLKDGKLELDC